MCVIYACSTSLPTVEELENGAASNEDGGGIAWLGKKGGKPRVFWKKGFENEKDVLAFIKKEKLTYPIAIHFRTASIGGKQAALCHPFPVELEASLALEGDAESVLFHNGHMGRWETWTLDAGLAAPGDITFPDGPWSDSRALAWVTSLRGEGVIRFLNDSSRVLVFSSFPYAYKEKYSPTTHHFAYWGNWITDKAGWKQSINTFQRARDRAQRTSWEQEGFRRGTHGGLVQTYPGGVAHAASVWTMGELEKILKDMEEERKHAELVAAA